MFIKHRVAEIETIRDWCRNIDYGRNLPLVGLVDGKIVGVPRCTSSSAAGNGSGPRERAGASEFRGRGLARAFIGEIIEIARQVGLEKVEAEFIGEQAAAMKMFALLGFSQLLRLEDYVKDMQAISHDYILMGLDLKTDEEYAGVGGE